MKLKHTDPSIILCEMYLMTSRAVLAVQVLGATAFFSNGYGIPEEIYFWEVNDAVQLIWRENYKLGSFTIEIKRLDLEELRHIPNERIEIFP